MWRASGVWVAGLFALGLSALSGCSPLSETPQVAVPDPNVKPDVKPGPVADMKSELDLPDMKPDPKAEMTPDMKPDPDPIRQEGRRAWQIGVSVQGRPLIAELYGDRGPVLFLLAAIHGSERTAVTFGEQVRTTLLSGLAREQGLQIIFIGAANPDGIAARTRHNASDIDLNRNFDAMSFGMGTHAGGTTPLSEPETVALTKVVERVAPSAVISVHCCVPTMDYDGPGGSIAQVMSQAANAKLKSLHGGTVSGYRTFPAEKLGASPGSMGSYVGVDLNIPIITLEFASNHYTRTAYQLESIHEAIRAAAEWTAVNGQAISDDLAKELEELESQVRSVAYGSDQQQGTSSNHPLRVDHLGGLEEAPVLILAGVRENSLQALHVAEHVRRVLLHEGGKQRLGAVSLVTALNPAGIKEQTSQTLLGVRVEDDVVNEPPESAEAQFLVELVSARPPRLVILIEGDDESVLQGSAKALRDAGVGATIAGGLKIREAALEGRLAEWLEGQGIPVLRVGVGKAYGEGDDRREPDFAFDDQRIFSDAISAVLKP